MSDTNVTGAAPRVATRERSTETKHSSKTSELIVFVAVVVGILISSLVIDQSFGADPAWRYITFAAVGYMVSRGLAKSGSRDPYRDDAR
jgi:hypothetical protein